MLTITPPLTDASLTAALAAVPPTGCIVQLPAGTWTLSNSIVLASNGTTLRGECGPHPYPGMAATRLVFPAGVPGILVTGQRCAVEGLLLSSIRTGSAAGIVVEGTRTLLRNCGIYEFGGVACTLDSSVGNVNLNLFRVESCLFARCGSHGLYIAGSNANAGNIIGVSCSGNGGAGFFEASTLGNTYTGCHADTNAGIAIGGQQVGAYVLYGASVFSSLLNCYSEEGQPPSWLGQKAIAIGGDHGAGWLAGKLGGYTPGTILTGNGDGLSVNLLDALRIAGMPAPPAKGVLGQAVPICTWGTLTLAWPALTRLAPNGS